MNQFNTSLSLFIILLYSFIAPAQTISSRVLDSLTQEPIPYVTIQLNNRGVVSNEEGRFSLLITKDVKVTDSLIISCIGFNTIAKPLNQFKDSAIYLSQKTIELKEVVLTNNQFTAKEIIEKVKENIDKNYDFNLTKKRLFFRESNHQNITKTDYILKKSTIDALNRSFLDSVMRSIPKKNSYYTEVLCDLYGNFSNEKQKINLIKASELYDKNNEVGLLALEKKFNDIIDKNVKPDSYFKLKSGLFGKKLGMDEFKGDEIDSTDAAALKKKLEDEKKREANRKVNFAKHRKGSLTNMLNGLFFQEKSKLNFINKSNKYEFKMLDLTYLADAAVYIIEFVPKGSANYKGTLYVNYEDFAIIRVDYENVKSLKSFNLLGISFNEFQSKGTMIFSKRKDGLYELQYLEKINGNRFGIRRPFKIIEKNKNVRGRRKQNELFVKLDMAISGRTKFELVIFDTENLSNTDFDNFKEINTMLPTYMPSYSSEFWKGHNIIEPNQAIRDFTIIAE